MEEFLDSMTGGAIWGIGFALALGAVRAASQGSQPVARQTMKGAVRIGDWFRNVTAEGRETLQDIYHEARTEVDNESREVPAHAEPKA
jgi:hypothetical protein